MSWGLVICSKCKHEVHHHTYKYPETNGWYHCETKSPICKGAKAVFPSRDRKEVKGTPCLLDEM